MNRRDWLRTLGGAALATTAWADETLPAHPRELRFRPLEFEPPDPAAHRRELPGGAVAYLVEDRALPLVRVSLSMRGGGYLTPRESWGLAGFTGSQMRAGGTASISARDLDEELAFLATEIGASIGDTTGGASMKCLTANLGRSLELFFDVLFHPGFDSQRFELAVAQTMQGLERRNDSTDSIAGREYARLLRGADHFSSWQTTKASIEAISIDKMREFHARYVHPSSMIFAVSGDFDTDEMVQRLGEALSAGRFGPKPELPPVPAPAHTPAPGVYMVQKGGVNQARVQMGHLGIERKNPDHIAVSVMNYILGGGGFISRITQRVRSDEGLAYSAGSSFTPGLHYPGTFTAAFQSQNPRCAQATGIVVEELRRIREEKVSQEELDVAKNYVIEVFPRFFAAAGQIAGTFANDELTEREPDYWKNYRARVAAVSADDIQRVCREYLHPDRLAILCVGEVDQVLAGNPDKPEYKFESYAPGGKIERLPLPDPVTMEYPEA